MVNVDKLRGKIVEKKLNITCLARKIGINKSTLYRKLKTNGEELSIKEAHTIAKELNLSLEELNSIFFSDFIEEFESKSN
ncbi:hypothetical protein GCM10008921_13660 [Metaclostridioides mangenotii]